MDVLLVTLALAAVVLLITRLHVNAAIALLTGSAFLGLAAGLGLEKTIAIIVTGFGDIMSEVGLMIGFGVLIGSLLLSLGALQRFTRVLLRLLGPQRLPYAFAASLSTVFPSIYGDVQLVLAAPLARAAASGLGKRGLGIMAGTLTAGILCGYAFMVPGLVTVTVAGLVGAPLGPMLFYGFIVGLPSALVTAAIWHWLVRLGIWDPERDEAPSEALLAEEHDVRCGEAVSGERRGALWLLLLPVIIPVLLIAVGTIAETMDVDLPILESLGTPIAALFLGLVAAYLLARRSLGRKATDQALSKGFNTMGQILLVTGVGGSFGAVIKQTQLADILGSLFAAETGGSVIIAVLLAWLIAAVLHLAVGSMAVAAVTASSTLATVMSQLGIAPAIIALSISAGVVFGVTVHSNFFWMFQSLLGVSTRGALKALTGVSAMASLVALPLVLTLALLT